MIDRFNVLEHILNFDNHRKSKHDRSVSTSELINSKYRAWKSLTNANKTYNLPTILKRSSTLGTGYHLRAEEALKENGNIILERFNERYIEKYNAWISGTFDLLVTEDDMKNYLGDHKTFYGKKFDKVERTTKQLSIYRWLNSDIIIEDKAYIYCVSQSHNYIDTIEVDLMSLENTESYILDTLEEISTEPSVDCFSGIKYNPCTYCEYECDFRKF